MNPSSTALVVDAELCAQTQAAQGWFACGQALARSGTLGSSQ